MALLAALSFCAGVALAATGYWFGDTPEAQLDRLGERYVRLALALAQQHPEELDSYWGPTDLKAAGAESDLETLQREVAALSADLAALSTSATPAEPAGLDQRKRNLIEHAVQLQHILAAVAGNSGLSFADEAAQLYDLPLPKLEDGRRRAILDELDTLVAGRGNLAWRVANFQRQFLVPAESRRGVFERALAECRQRTLAHLSLPAGEALSLAWSRDVTSPWHTYQGDYHSVLQVNDLRIAFASQALDIACHEGYPGHHTQFVLRDQAADSAMDGAVENTLALLRTPQSALREATANLGVDLLFTTDERLAFESQVLLPLAGVDSMQLDTHHRINRLLAELAPYAIPVLAQYHDGTLSAAVAIRQLERQALVSNPVELLEFVDHYGAYSAAYTTARAPLLQRLSLGAGANKTDWRALTALFQQGSLAPVPALTGGP
ncbi:hypothetical protein FV139_15140 [Parahaliea maris]|uniref:DUF885 domain-containing protein n=1 Tax=Parahaliea maris TaxID=2716870 RepID=A0A5C8ZU91_9GAMM|nr:hypothetical protein [Parahaliea maris]TXS92058.1 hypothetical protein FV139_15140 [Parahaliea maris]